MLGSLGLDPLLWLLTEPWEQGEGAMGAPRMGPRGDGEQEGPARSTQVGSLGCWAVAITNQEPPGRQGPPWSTHQQQEGPAGSTQEGSPEQGAPIGCPRDGGEGPTGRAESSGDTPASPCALTQVLGGAAGLLDQAVLQLGQVEVADDDLGVLQAVVVHQVLQLPARGTSAPTGAPAPTGDPPPATRPAPTLRFLCTILSECR